eukprot:gene14544-17763_t
MYQHFVSQLASRGCVVLCTPYTLALDHLATAEAVLDQLEALQRARIRPSPSLSALPSFNIGHGLGALLHIYLSALFRGPAHSSGGAALAKALGAKGTIVDSGTTDTYLPASLAGAFKAAFLELTGLHYDNKNIKIDERTYAL